jgi:hypothetical protein
MKEVDACRLWVQRDFSMIPTTLLEKAYERDYYDEIQILAPTFDDFKKEYREDNGCEQECDECCDECLEIYEQYNPKIPMWGWVFSPDDPCDQKWIRKHADKVAECGFIVYETDEIGVYLGVDGAGYDFYESHWLPLYRARGLKWHDE